MNFSFDEHVEQEDHKKHLKDECQQIIKRKNPKSEYQYLLSDNNQEISDTLLSTTQSEAQ